MSSMRIRRLLAVIAVGTVLVPFLANTSQAIVYASAEVCLAVFDAAVRPDTVFEQNEIIVMKSEPPEGVTCFDATTLVTYQVESVPTVLGRNLTDSRGRYDSTPLNMRIPRDFPPGVHTASVTGTVSGRPVTYSRAITVIAAAAAPPSGAIPITGADILLLTVWGLVILFVGSVLVSATWKRWRQAKLEEELMQFAPSPNGHLRDEALEDLRPAPQRVEVPVAPRAPSPPPVQTSWVQPPAPVATTEGSVDVQRVQEEVRAWTQPAP